MEPGDPLNRAEDVVVDDRVTEPSKAAHARLLPGLDLVGRMRQFHLDALDARHPDVRVTSDRAPDLAAEIPRGP